MSLSYEKCKERLVERRADGFGWAALASIPFLLAFLGFAGVAYRTTVERIRERQQSEQVSRELAQLQLALKANLAKGTSFEGKPLVTSGASARAASAPLLEELGRLESQAQLHADALHRQARDIEGKQKDFAHARAQLERWLAAAPEATATATSVDGSPMHEAELRLAEKDAQIVALTAKLRKRDDAGSGKKTLKVKLRQLQEERAALSGALAKQRSNVGEERAPAAAPSP